MNPIAASLVVFAGLFGALGVAGAAAAAHGGPGGDRLALASAIALVHAPALLALAALPVGLIRLRGLAGLFLVGGTLLFSGDLAARALVGGRLFPQAAPTGGFLLIAGWLAVAVGAALAAAGSRRRTAVDRPSGGRG